MNKIKWAENKHCAKNYVEGDLSIFSNEEVEKILRFQQTHPLYTKTPLRSLTNLAEHLSVASIQVKDESYRFGLNAFKVLGGIYAMGKYIANKLDRDIADLSFSELQTAEVKEKLGEITFISATDGNHGRGVAWAARELGQNARIYLPKGSSQERVEAIQNEGAYAAVTEVNYDETVRMCATLAEENGWVMVQDTGWEGYEEIPEWIMQGYASMGQEIVDEINRLEGEAPTHIFLQAGVGSFAAGIAAYFVEHYQEKAPKIIIVEPNIADCYYKSFMSEEGTMESVTGDLNTIMAGLACGEPNRQAYSILRRYACATFSCDDSIAALGMRVLGNPLGDDARVISGESGAVPLGLLYYLLANRRNEICDALQLTNDARILMISTEGDTDKQHYLDVVWNGSYPVSI